MDERQGLSEASGIGRGGDATHDLAIDGEFGAVVHHVVVVGDDAVELHLLLAFEFEESPLAAKSPLRRDTAQPKSTSQGVFSSVASAP